MFYPRSINRPQYLLGMAMWLCGLKLFLPGIIGATRNGMPIWVIATVSTVYVLLKFFCLDIPRMRNMGWSLWHLPWLILVATVILFFVPTGDEGESEPDAPEGQFFTSERIGVFVIVLLTASALGAVCYLSPRYYPPKNPASSATTSPSANAKAPVPDKTKTALAASANSPTAPVQTGQSAFKVESIFYQNPESSSAVVNGNSVMTGDHVGGWTVTAIDSDSVTLQSNKDVAVIPWKK